MSIMSKIFKIGTHSGTFHCDEVLACYMLKKLPEYINAEIIRSRDPKELAPCNIVVDVGGEYNPSEHKYDHHQNTFHETMSSLRPNIVSPIRLSSSGLVYHHFGESVLEAVAGISLEKPLLEKLFKYVYFHFLQEIDAVDNGVPMYEVGEPRYSIHTSLSQRVSHLNPDWTEEGIKDPKVQFEKAMVLAGGEFESCVTRFFTSWWPARRIVEEAVNNRFKVHESGEIIEFGFCPWKSHLFDIESEQDMAGTVKFAIYQDTNKSWRVAGVPVTLGSFVLRIPLGWMGLRDKELQEASGVSDGTFIHATGFIGGALSRDGVMALAVKTLKQSKQQD